MILEERLLEVLRMPHISEKASFITEKHNTFIFRVEKKCTKLEIKHAIETLLNVKVKNVNVLIVKGKVKRHSKYIGRRKSWKKAYITLEQGQKLDFVGNNE